MFVDFRLAGLPVLEGRDIVLYKGVSTPSPRVHGIEEVRQPVSRGVREDDHGCVTHPSEDFQMAVDVLGPEIATGPNVVGGSGEEEVVIGLQKREEATQPFAKTEP